MRLCAQSHRTVTRESRRPFDSTLPLPNEKGLPLPVPGRFPPRKVRPCDTAIKTQWIISRAARLNSMGTRARKFVIDFLRAVLRSILKFTRERWGKVLGLRFRTRREEWTRFGFIARVISRNCGITRTACLPDGTDRILRLIVLHDRLSMRDGNGWRSPRG